MKKLLFPFILISHLAFAQEIDSLVSDSVEIVLPEHVIGVNVMGGISLTPNPTSAGFGWMQTIGVGVRFDNMEAGFTVSTFDTEFEKRLVFPNVFTLIYRHGGGYFSYRVKETEYLGFAPFVSGQIGDMVWERSNTGEDFIRDKFNLIQLGVKIDFPFLQKVKYLEYIRPEAILGYQLMNDLSLAGVSKKDFSGFFIGFNVKVGYFNQ